MSLRQSTISPLWSKSSLVGVSGPSNASMCALLYSTELAAYESACMVRNLTALILKLASSWLFGNWLVRNFYCR